MSDTYEDMPELDRLGSEPTDEELLAATEDERVEDPVDPAILEAMPELDRPGEDEVETDLLEDATEQVVGEGTQGEQDLSMNDLVQDGADPLDLQTTAGVLESQNGVDDYHDETIDQRVLQEEYEPGSAIVPPPRGVVPEV